MIWFGSSAGVAISNLFPEAKSVFVWIREGWWIALGYVVGFFALIFSLGWHPHEKEERNEPSHAFERDIDAAELASIK